MIFPAQLKGILAAVDKDSSRYAGMNGLHVERNADSVEMTAVATNGRQMIVASWSDEDENHRHQKTVTNVDAKALAKACREKKVWKVRIGELMHDRPYNCDEKVTVDAELLDSKCERLSRQDMPVDQHRFPRWREVIPDIRVAKVVPTVDAEDRQLHYHICLDPKAMIDMLKVLVDIADDGQRAIDLFLPICQGRPIVAKYKNQEIKATSILMPVESDGHNEWTKEVYVASTVPESESTGVRIDAPVFAPTMPTADLPATAAELKREDFGEEHQPLIDELLAEGLPLADILAELQAALQNEETAVAL